MIGGKSKLKFQIKGAANIRGGRKTINAMNGGIFSKLSAFKKSFFDDIEDDGEDENEYPFDDGWKCSII